MSGAQPQRTCIVTGDKLAPGEGLRIVLAPDGTAAVDWRGKLPGHGAWVSWTREALEGVATKGRLQRAFKQAVAVSSPDWPLAQARAWVLKRQTELIGLASKSGQAQAGGGVAERAVRRGQVAALVLSADAGDTVASDWAKTAKGYELELHRSLLTSEEIGLALGKSGPRSILALGNGSISRSLQIELKRGKALL